MTHNSTHQRALKSSLHSGNKRKSKGNSNCHYKVNSKEITLFTRQMATLITAGIPLIQAFDVIKQSQSQSDIWKLIQHIKTDVQRGLAFHAALRKHPFIFDELYCNLIFIGEESGCLDKILDRISNYKEKLETLRRRVRKSLVYPLCVILVAILVTALLLLKVVPTFKEMFESLGAELPFLTHFVIGLSENLKKHLFLIIFSLSIVFYLARRNYQKNKSFRKKLQTFSLQIPFLGKILVKNYISRFARTLCITSHAGLPIIEALDMIADSIGNILFTEAILKTKQGLIEGSSLSMTLAATALFPEQVIQMISIGEESGTLDLMLEKIANLYEEEMDGLMEELTTFLEPCIMIILGILVGGLMIAMYLPIFQMGELF